MSMTKNGIPMMEVTRPTGISVPGTKVLLRMDATDKSKEPTKADVTRKYR